MKYAWIENAVIRDLCNGVPDELYHPDIAQHYDTQVPDEAINGDGWDGVKLVKLVNLVKSIVSDNIAPPTQMRSITQISPIEFKLRFTAQERIAMRVARPTDLGVDDLFDIIEDPRLTTVDLELAATKEAVAYLVLKGYVVQARVDAILQTDFPISGTTPPTTPPTIKVTTI